MAQHVLLFQVYTYSLLRVSQMLGGVGGSSKATRLAINLYRVVFIHSRNIMATTRI